MASKLKKTESGAAGRAAKFTTGELNIILEEVAKNVKLITDLRTKLNGQKKDSFWQTVTNKINSISPQVRDRQQIQSKWSDWLYYAKKKEQHWKSK